MEGIEAGWLRGGGECVTGEVGEVVTPRGRAPGSRPYAFPHRNEGECIKLLGNLERSSGILCLSLSSLRSVAMRKETMLTPGRVVENGHLGFGVLQNYFC